LPLAVTPQLRTTSVDLPIGAVMIRILLAATLALGGLSTAARAQNCIQYPAGPQRFQCASRAHPQFLAKRERCQEEARAQGLSTNNGSKMGRYVQSCMQR